MNELPCKLLNKDLNFRDSRYCN